jgi:predicted negative regulator of RcsB-dependent stress response
VRRFLLVVLLVAGACAPKTVPPTAIGPRFPGFIFPPVPQALDNSDAAAAHRIGWDALQAGDLRQAERRFGSALRDSPDFFPSEAALGYVALARKDNRAAIDHFSRALSREPAYVPALVGRGEALLASGRPEEAIASFEAAVAADPSLEGYRDRVAALRFKLVEQTIASARGEAAEGRLDAARDRYRQAIDASPESAFLYRELALVEQRAGRFDSALEAARRAADLDKADPRPLVTIGEVHEARGDFEAAARAYEQAAAIEPGPEIAARIEGVRDRAALAVLPASYRAIETAGAVTRGDVAALIGVRLDQLVAKAGRSSAVVMTDTRRHWAASWILAVARAGIMPVYPNHTFQPDATVTRGDLADALARALEVIAIRDPKAGRGWREAKPAFADLSPGHPSYAAAALAVSAGALAPLEGNTFQVSRPVTGAEAVAAVERVRALWTRRP